MNRLTELNNYSNELISYEDARDPNVIFNLAQAIDQTLEINENASHIIPKGIEVIEIIDYTQVTVYVELDFSNAPSAVSFLYDSLPFGVSIVETSTNVFKISPIVSNATYDDILENVRVQMPFNLNGYYPYTVTIYYTIGATTFNKSWDVLLTINEIQYLGAVSDYVYVPNRTTALSATTITANTEEFNPTWTITITPSVAAPIDTITSAGVDGTTDFNNTTKVFTITGNKTQVNSHLASISVDYSYSTDNFYWNYTLSNNFTSDIDIAIQFATNNELGAVLDSVMSFALLSYKAQITGAILNTIATVDVDVYRIQDSNAELNDSFFITAQAEPNIKQGAASLTAISTVSATAFTGDALRYSRSSSSSSVYFYRGYNTDITVDWGDGTSQRVTEADLDEPFLLITKNYGSTATREIVITGSSDLMLIYCGGNSTITTWGSDVFDNAPRFNALSIVPSYWPSNWTSLYNFFGNSPSFNDSNVSTWDTSNVVNMGYCFDSAELFNQDISSWDTGNVVNMYRMFKDATAFNQNIGSWDTGSVITMYMMFYNAIAFNQNIGSWDTGLTTTMYSMFRNAESFNQDIGTWSTNNVTEMSQMFYDATVFDQDLTGWCVTNITSEPSNFAGGTATLSPSNKPIWGTCP